MEIQSNNNNNYNYVSKIAVGHTAHVFIPKLLRSEQADSNQLNESSAREFSVGLDNDKSIFGSGILNSKSHVYWDGVSLEYGFRCHLAYELIHK